MFTTIHNTQCKLQTTPGRHLGDWLRTLSFHLEHFGALQLQNSRPDQLLLSIQQIFLNPLVGKNAKCEPRNHRARGGSIHLEGEASAPLALPRCKPHDPGKNAIHQCDCTLPVVKMQDEHWKPRNDMTYFKMITTQNVDMIMLPSLELT